MAIKALSLLILIVSSATVRASAFASDEDCDDVILYSIRDAKLNKCFIPLGSKCRGIPSVENFTCPPNAQCSSGGQCECKNQYVASGTDKFSCVLGRTLGEVCNYQDQKCDTKYAKLTCNSKCQCDSRHIWNAYSKKCIAKDCGDRNFEAKLDRVTGKCMMKIGQTLGRYSTMPSPESYLEEQLLICPPNTTLVQGQSTIRKSFGQVFTCACIKGLVANSEGRTCYVQKWYKEACGPGDLCDPATGLACLNKRCRCAEDAVWSPEDSLCYSDDACKARDWDTFYDPKTNKCIMKIKRVCENSGQPGGLQCPFRATCTNLVPGRFSGKEVDFLHEEPLCVCNSGYKETSDRRHCIPAPCTGPYPIPL